MLNLHSIREKKNFINRLAKKHGVGHIRLFGSVVKGKTRQSSDIDLLVKMHPGKSLLDLIAFSNALGDYLKTPVDVVDEEGLSPYLKKEILSSSVPL